MQYSAGKKSQNLLLVGQVTLEKIRDALVSNAIQTHKVKTFCELYKDLPSRGNQCEKVVIRMRRVLDDVCGPNIIWMLAVLCDDIVTLSRVSLCSLSAAGIPNQNAIAEYFL